MSGYSSNKAVPTEANLCKLEKDPVWFHVRWEVKRKTAEICGCRCQCSFGRTSCLIAHNIHEEMICSIPWSKNFHVAFEEEGRLP